jgi:hypothetical protein
MMGLLAGGGVALLVAVAQHRYLHNVLLRAKGDVAAKRHIEMVGVYAQRRRLGNHQDAGRCACWGVSNNFLAGAKGLRPGIKHLDLSEIKYCVFHFDFDLVHPKLNTKI